MLLSISASVFYPRFAFLLHRASASPLFISLLASPVSFFTGTPLLLVSFFCAFFHTWLVALSFSLLVPFPSSFFLVCVSELFFFFSLSFCGMEDGQLLCNIFFDGFDPSFLFFLACGYIFFSRTFSVIIFYLCLTRCPKVSKNFKKAKFLFLLYFVYFFLVQMLL